MLHVNVNMHMYALFAFVFSTTQPDHLQKSPKLSKLNIYDSLFIFKQKQQMMFTSTCSSDT